MAKTDIMAVVKKYSRQLMSLPGVVGVGQGMVCNEVCIKVFIEKDSASTSGQIPDSIEGYPVHVEVTGDFMTYPDKGSSQIP